MADERCEPRNLTLLDKCTIVESRYTYDGRPARTGKAKLPAFPQLCNACIATVSFAEVCLRFLKLIPRILKSDIWDIANAAIYARYRPRHDESLVQ